MHLYDKNCRKFDFYTLEGKAKFIQSIPDTFRLAPSSSE